MDANQPQPAPTPLAASEGTIAIQTPPLAASLAAMRVEIESLLDEETRKEFKNTATTIMRLGNKTPKLVEPRRRKIRYIVERNSQIVVLYNNYAKAHAQKEKRLTYRLPVLEELEVQVREAAEKEREEKGKEDVDMDESDDEHMKFEQQEKFAPPLKAVGIRTETGQASLAKDKEAEYGREEPRMGTSRHEIDIAAGPEDEDTGVLARENDMSKREGTTVGLLDQAHSAEAIAMETDGPALDTFRQVETSDTPSSILACATMQIPVGGARIDDHAFAVVAMEEKRDAHLRPPQQAINGAAPRAVHQLKKGANMQQLCVENPPSKPLELVTPVVNPEAFPIQRIQDIQALRYPLAKVVGVWAHHDTSGNVIQVTVDMRDGPVNHLLINDARIITAFGLREGNDFISVHDNYLRDNETFKIRIFPNQRSHDIRAFVVGEMVPARHAYLYWLDLRGVADPTGEPYAQEARTIATHIGRRAPDVWKEIDGYWQLENGSGGRMYRENRMRYLGDDPVYHKDTTFEKKKATRSMWG